MKKIFALAAALLLMTGCDDGDMTLNEFNVQGSPARCSDTDLIYKDDGTQLMILQVPESEFLNIPSELINDDPENPEYEAREITLGGSGRSIIYRNYDGEVNGNSVLCGTIPPASPRVVEEWQGEGTISIITVPVREAETGRILRYSHTITMDRITFTKGDEEVRIEDVEFGVLTTELGYTFRFEAEGQEAPVVNDCENGYVYKNRGTEALVLDFGEDTFGSTLGEQTIDVSSTEDNNEITLDIYSSNVPAASICSENPPITPVVVNRWIAISGTVRIITTVNPVTGGFDYEIRFYNVVFRNTSGEEFTAEPDPDSEDDYYYFGTYTPE